MDDVNGRRFFLSSALAGVAAGSLTASSARSEAQERPGSPLVGGEPSAPVRRVSVLDFGAQGDAQPRRLSEMFPTLAAARARFPASTSLDTTLDSAAIQAAIDHASREGAAVQTGAQVLLPRGRYVLSEPLRMPNNVALIGEGMGVSIIDNQNLPLDAPLVVNADPNVALLWLADLSLHGGTHGVRLTVRDYVDRCRLDRVVILLQTDKNFECNKLLQQAVFTNCTFGMSPFGVYAAGWTTNAASFHHCSFESHSKAHLTLRGAECVNIYGGRFEAGGRPGEVVLDLEGAAAVNVQGVYFEDVHELLLRDARSRNGVTFSGCHFTGAKAGDHFVPFRFQSDGVVTFGSNDWNLATLGPTRVMLAGANPGLRLPGRVYEMLGAGERRILSETTTLRPGQRRTVLTARRRGTPGNAAEAVASLRLLGAGTPVALEVRASSNGTAPLALRVTPPGSGAGSAGASPQLTVRPGPTADIALLVAEGGGPATAMRWAIETADLSGPGGAWIDFDVD